MSAVALFKAKLCWELNLEMFLITLIIRIGKKELLKIPTAVSSASAFYSIHSQNLAAQQQSLSV